MDRDFYKIKRLPPYVFAEVNDMKAKARADGADIIDLGMGNPDFPVKCIPTCLKAGQPAKYLETTVEKHYQEMYKATYASGIITS